MFKLTSIAAALVSATSLFLIAGSVSASSNSANATQTIRLAQAEAVKAPAKPSRTYKRPAKTTAPAEVMVMDSSGIRMAPAINPAQVDPAKLAEFLIFEAEGFDLNQATQEGTTGRHRLTQDEIQKACSLGKGKELDDKTREKVMALAAASIKYPEGGIKLGDWKKGRELAWSGYGFRTAHNPDDHTKGTPGGNCYNCHQLATDRTGGNIGPALTGYGARGTSPDMLKYTYDVIYNPHVFFACTNMPRMGAVGVLNQQQIADIMAYLFDPNSPVNKQ